MVSSVAPRLLSPEAARRWLARRYANQHRAWLGGEGSWPLSVPLGELTEKAVSELTPLIREWIDAWSAWSDVGQLEWVERRWSRLGSQRLPARLRLASAVEVARVVGESERFERAQTRRAQLIERWPALASAPQLCRHFDCLADYPDADVQRLVALLTWLEANRSSGLYLRQLPVAGMDTKWCDSRRRAVVTDLLLALRGQNPPREFHELCGLRRPPLRLRVFLLCPDLRAHLGGLRDLEAPLQQIAALPVRPTRALIVENLESGIALPDLPGCVAFMGLGFGVSLLAEIPWLESVAALYWGDIDTHGFAILGHARAAVPGVRSVLMDAPTLLHHRALWGHEATPYSASPPLNLTGAEQALFDGLRTNVWGEGVRLEQERLPWAEAMAAIRVALLGE